MGFGWDGPGRRPRRRVRPDQVVAYKRKVVGWDFVIQDHLYFIGIGHLTGSIKLVLPRARSLDNGHAFVIKDEFGDAGEFPVTIETQGGDIIEGTGSIVLDSPNAAVNIYTNGTNKYFIY